MTTPVADPKDGVSADAIIAALYDANTVMVDQKRGADRFRSLFAPGARLIPTLRMGPKANLRTLTVEDYVKSAAPDSDRSRSDDGGINSIQLFNDGSRWWVQRGGRGGPRLLERADARASPAGGWRDSDTRPARHTA
ncbi:MAG TPA: hypothetical protein VK636_18260 [Gemmatimonadaceae bacterium]|nr:hypothetical protein [Gemmatimonadaceae bacterium]